MSIIPKGGTLHIREVWADNLEHEFELIREIVDDYPYLAMDTEFPGVVVRPVGTFKSSADYHYQTLRANVDMLKLIQLGLTFSDEDGNLPRCGTRDYCVWQFNFREFNLKEDVYAQDSIELLRKSGIDFQAIEERGIDSQRFGELLMSSGIVLNENVHWVTFHSGYDFGYLLKLLTCQNLPAREADFFNLLRTYFPTVYDIKYLMKFCDNLHGGLNRLAEMLEVERIGPCHQAGSDSLLTSSTFRKLKDGFLNGSTEKLLNDCSPPEFINVYPIGSGSNKILGGPRLGNVVAEVFALLGRESRGTKMVLGVLQDFSVADMLKTVDAVEVTAGALKTMEIMTDSLCFAAILKDRSFVD